jgi:hypothetical protein
MNRIVRVQNLKNKQPIVTEGEITMLKKLMVGLMIVSLLTTATVSAATSMVWYRPPIDGVYQVPARNSQFFYVKLQAGVKYRISVNGDGDTDLDLFVRNQSGRWLGRDNDSSDDAVVYVVPGDTDIFTMEVKNLGSVYNECLHFQLSSYPQLDGVAGSAIFMVQLRFCRNLTPRGVSSYES